MGKNRTFVLLFAFVLLFSLVGAANAAEINSEQMTMNNSAAVSEANDEQAGMMDDTGENDTVGGNGNMIDNEHESDTTDKVDREENNDQIRDFPGYRMVPYNANNSYFNCSWNNRPQRYNGMMGGYR